MSNIWREAKRLMDADEFEDPKSLRVPLEVMDLIHSTGVRADPQFLRRDLVVPIVLDF